MGDLGGMETREDACPERVKGIEPSCPAWEAGALPLSYTRNLLLKSFSDKHLCRFLLFQDKVICTLLYTRYDTGAERLPFSKAKFYYLGQDCDKALATVRSAMFSGS